MKLYFAPGACSLSPHIVLREAGATFDIEQVDLATKKTKSGGDFTAVNAKGYVPALVLDNGQVLTEGPAIVQYIADSKPASKLAPAAGTAERVRLQEWLNYIGTELHKSFSPLFNPTASEDWKNAAKEVLSKRFDYVAKQLEKKPYLLGDNFSVADAYLFVVQNWGGFVGFDIGKWPSIKAFAERVSARPAVQAALKAEGLVK